MHPPHPLPPAATIATALIGALLLCQSAWAESSSPQACTTGARDIQFGFYAFFAPLSHSADSDPASDGFNTHLGYEADLLSALEAMPGAGLSFVRRPIAEWDDIWLRPAGARYDMVGGGITILDSRTRNAAGEKIIAFTAGHIAFRQSLLVRAADAQRLARHDALTGEVRVGALAGTTGEARLLQLTGLADAGGVLKAGVRVDTPRGALTADGGADYFITAAAESPNLAGRRHLHPPSNDQPQVVYLGDQAGEAELLAALDEGHIDAIARGEIGNRNAAHASAAAFTVTALAPQPESAGFALATKDTTLIACLNKKINHLTNHRRIGYAEWLEDTDVFMRRAGLWNDGAR